MSLNELKRGLQGLPPLPAASAPVEGKVKMQYIGASAGGVTWFGKYYAGNNDTDRYIDADPDDVDKLANTGMFVKADVLPVVEPATMPIVAVEPPVDVYLVEDAPAPAIAAKTMDDAPAESAPKRKPPPEGGKGRK